eukprot:195411_1
MAMDGNKTKQLNSNMAIQKCQHSKSPQHQNTQRKALSLATVLVLHDQISNPLTQTTSPYHHRVHVDHNPDEKTNESTFPPIEIKLIPDPSIAIYPPQIPILQQSSTCSNMSDKIIHQHILSNSMSPCNQQYSYSLSSPPSIASPGDINTPSNTRVLRVNIPCIRSNKSYEAKTYPNHNNISNNETTNPNNIMYVLMQDSKKGVSSRISNNQSSGNDGQNNKDDDKQNNSNDSNNFNQGSNSGSGSSGSNSGNNGRDDDNKEEKKNDSIDNKEEKYDEEDKKKKDDVDDDDD